MQCKVKFNVCRKRPYPRVRQNETVTISREFHEVYLSCFRLRFWVFKFDCAGFHFNLGEFFIVLYLSVFQTCFSTIGVFMTNLLTPQGGGTTRSPKQTRCRLATCRVGGDCNRSSFFHTGYIMISVVLAYEISCWCCEFCVKWYEMMRILPQ